MVLPERVSEQNAHQEADALADEIDRETMRSR
jgi:hypothetical protein